MIMFKSPSAGRLQPLLIQGVIENHVHNRSWHVSGQIESNEAKIDAVVEALGAMAAVLSESDQVKLAGLLNFNTIEVEKS
jgi:hypothetical protein